ncbi:MAG: sigma-54 interaction domain-containing protein [Desulfopila sp.]
MAKSDERTFSPHGIEFAMENFEAIFSEFHEGILITNQHGVIVYYNSAMGKVDDLKPEEAIGKKVLEVYDLTEQQSPTMQCLASGLPIVKEPLFYRTHLGKVTNAFLNVYPLFKKRKLVGAICFVVEYHMIEKNFSISPSLKPHTPGKKNGTRFTFSDIIGRDTDLSECVRIAQMAAQSPSPVLIVGATGTGKELFAQAIHNFSAFHRKPFVPINCATIPETLLEGILFGTSKGAFTGSIEKAGLFEQANGGTLFLDELNSMPLALQAKLLRVLQEKKVRRIGAHHEIDLSLKIISSVNMDPHEEIVRGHLRRDLFYRLGVVFIQIPTLRERKRDMAKLTSHFIEKFNARLKRTVTGLTPEIERFFDHYDWPGNVRELEHVIEGAMNLVGSAAVIDESHLPQHFLRSLFAANNTSGGLTSSPSTSTPVLSGPAEEQYFQELCSSQQSLQKLNEVYQAAEKSLIKRALTLSSGNIAQAGKALGLSSPQALQYKMKKLNLARNQFLKKSL